jgi:hypothetical protein
MASEPKPADSANDANLNPRGVMNRCAHRSALRMNIIECVHIPYRTRGAQDFSRTFDPRVLAFCMNDLNNAVVTPAKIAESHQEGVRGLPGAPGEVRTPRLLFRNKAIYPGDLQSQRAGYQVAVAR